VSESGATTPGQPAGGQSSATTPTTPLGVNPLKDPNNILSKRSVYFDFDSALVKDEFKPLVQAHARYLVEHPSTRMTVQGNADERGSAEYNLALGQRRSDSVKQAMNVLGASDRQIDTVSFGKEKPKALGHDEDAWAQNRRTDIVYAGE
jgi:peptidoglycan-associated lipoprotein